MRNKASGIGASLKRKIGPLPAWAWITLLGIGIWYYRNKFSQTVSGTGTGSVAPAPVTPQPVTTLGPGEAAYDPNTGQLTTNPGGDGFGNSTDWASIFGGLADAISGAIGAAGGGTGSGQGGGSAGGTGKRTPTKSGRPPAHHARPKTGVTKRTPKPKHGAPKHTTKPPTHGKTRTRSGSSLRNKLAGRTGGTKGKPPAAGKTRGGVKPQATKPRTLSTKAKQPVVTKPVVKQRTATGHNTQAQAKTAAPHVAAPAHRPSAPPPRTASRNISTKPAPKPAPPRRKK